MPRLTRKEQQAKTRSSLLAAAKKVFCRHGLQKASIDEVAETAGYTKGAFYANFKSKEELFLAMLDQHFAERIEEVERTAATDEPPEEQARQAGADFVRYIASDPEWERLFFEFAIHAVRNEDFREELLTRYRSLCSRIDGVIEQRSQELGWPSPPVGIGLMLFAMSNGMALEKLLEPDAVDEELYGTMMLIFFTGLRTLAETGAPSS